MTTTPSAFLSADHGPALRSAADRAIPIVAAVITAAWLAYDLGRQLRLTLEQCNDQLAGAWVALLGLTSDAPDASAAPAAPAPVVLAPAAAASAPIALMPAPKRTAPTKTSAARAPRVTAPRAPRSKALSAA
jgi:hypothetical protein